MGLDELHLQVLAKSSSDLAEKKNAQTGALVYLKTLYKCSSVCSSAKITAKGAALGSGG